MPRMDGYGLSRAIRELEQNDSRLPIIATTADAMSETRQRCLDAGMDDYIIKPLRIEMLSEKLARWLPEGQKMRTIQPVKVRSAEDVATTAVANDISHEVINANALCELLGSDDPKLLAEFYHEFLESASPTMEDMCHAIDEGSVKEVSALAHKLKSSVISVGAQAFYECCLQMEAWGKSGDSNALKQKKEKLQLHMQQARDWILQHYPKAD
jgi:two-component system sensor histidine kinase/response regulator